MAACGAVSEPPGLHPGTLPLPQSWQPVKEEMNNKVNKVKVANFVNEGYEFPGRKLIMRTWFGMRTKKCLQQTTTRTHLMDN